MTYHRRGRRDSQLAPVAAVVALLLLTVAMGITATRAASLGKLQVVSRLGQPFDARIVVAAASRHELDTLGARLASGDAYRQAGLSYGSALQSLRFQLARQRGAQHYIHVTSTQPLNEPVLDLLVELAWFEGTASYDYSALIDPAATGSETMPAAPLAAHEPVVSSRPATRAGGLVKTHRSHAAAAEKRETAIAQKIKQKEEQLAIYKHRLAAAQERIAELQWTMHEQEKMLAAMPTETIARDMRAAAAPSK